MATETEIVNLALGRIGVSIALTDLDTDTSAEAQAAQRIFDQDRDAVLRDFPWPFATTYAEPTLAYGTSEDAANADWQFAYRYPSNAMKVRRVLLESERTKRTRTPFRIGRDGNLASVTAWDSGTAYVFGDLASRLSINYQCILAHTNQQPPNATYWVVVSIPKLILTDLEDAFIEYTFAVTDSSEFDALFVSALGWKLASSLAPSLSRMTNIQAVCLQMYEIDKTRAQAGVLTEAQRDPEPEAEWIDERD